MSGKKSSKKSKKNTITEKKAGDGVSWWDNTQIQSTNNFSTNVNFSMPDEKKKKDKNAGKKNNKDTKKPAKSRVKDTENFDESSNGNKKDEDKEDDIPLVSLENPSPAIWTYGCIVVFIIVIACEVLQSGSFQSMAKNPMFGPSEEAMILLGAKLGKKILDGEWWRFLTANFLHSGLIHLLIVIIFILYSKKVEQETGFWRAFFVFLLSGVFGFILSGLLIPEMVSCGATGCAFGFFGLQLSDLISTWRMHNDSGKRLGVLIVFILIGVILGLTPFIDNFCNLGGFVMGILFALMLLPNLTFGKCERICHGFIAFISFPITTIVFCICLVLFFRRIDGNKWCDWCGKVNCINFNDWCPNITSTQETEYYITV